MTKARIDPFVVEVSSAELEALRQRLARTRWPDEISGIGWEQGVPLEYLKDVCAYWQSDYDWRVCEQQLNSSGQFKTEIDGVGIHFLHARSPYSGAFPVIFTHGWPGSVVEFLKVIGPLVDPVAHGGRAEDALDVVCPSLPGFGFSGHPMERGWNTRRVANAWAELMSRLGYDRYGAQGGSWGGGVSTDLALRDPDHCAAIHLTSFLVQPDPATMDQLTDSEQAALADMAHFEQFDSGYMKQQMSRPQTLAYGLSDSPVGQAAWLLEKFWSLTDCDGHPENILTRDEMLNDVMLYWLTNNAGSSSRLHWETYGVDMPDMSLVPTPTGCTVFPREPFRPPRSWVDNRYNVVYWSEAPKGGHLAAFEQPALFVEEVRAFFRLVR